jgi:hypothetical protein
MNHSNIVGGSTAKRVMACPASVQLCAKMTPKESSEHADRGTLLHNVIAEILEFDKSVESCIGTQYKNQTLTEDLIYEKIDPALQAFEAINPAEYMVETRVGFGDFLPGVFGSTDLLGRRDNRAFVVDWKFGDGVIVDAEENEQLMFYAAAAMRTDAAKWVFDGVDEIECIIVQPPEVRRWVTTPARIAAFEVELLRAVRESSWPEPTMKSGDHCRWCAAKPVCPEMTGAVDRAVQMQIVNLDKQSLSDYMMKADMLEDWIKDLRALAFQVLESGSPLPGYKLVAKRGTRQWIDETAAKNFLLKSMVEPYKELEVISPAQAEKALKKIKAELPTELVVSVSSGSTLARDSDPRPEVLNLGKQLAQLTKLQ